MWIGRSNSLCSSGLEFGPWLKTGRRKSCVEIRSCISWNLTWFVNPWAFHHKEREDGSSAKGAEWCDEGTQISSCPSVTSIRLWWRRSEGGSPFDWIVRWWEKAFLPDGGINLLKKHRFRSHLFCTVAFFFFFKPVCHQLTSSSVFVLLWSTFYNIWKCLSTLFKLRIFSLLLLIMCGPLLQSLVVFIAFNCEWLFTIEPFPHTVNLAVLNDCYEWFEVE